MMEFEKTVMLLLRVKEGYRIRIPRSQSGPPETLISADKLRSDVDRGEPPMSFYLVKYFNKSDSLWLHNGYRESDNYYDNRTTFQSYNRLYVFSSDRSFSCGVDPLTEKDLKSLVEASEIDFEIKQTENATGSPENWLVARNSATKSC